MCRSIITITQGRTVCRVPSPTISVPLKPRLKRPHRVAVFLRRRLFEHRGLALRDAQVDRAADRVALALAELEAHRGEILDVAETRARWTVFHAPALDFGKARRGERLLVGVLHRQLAEYLAVDALALLHDHRDVGFERRREIVHVAADRQAI